MNLGMKVLVTAAAPEKDDLFRQNFGVGIISELDASGHWWQVWRICQPCDQVVP